MVNPYDFDEEFYPEEARILDDITMLKTAYRNELISPDILDYKLDLISRMKEKISVYDDALEEEPRSMVDDSFRIMLYEMDVERIKYLVVSYLRTRLLKIEKHHKFIINQNQLSRLSADEIAFLQDYAKMNELYFESTVFDHFKQPPYVSPGQEMDEASSVIVNYTQYREDEMDCPIPNRKKLIGVKVHKGHAAIDIPIEDDGDNGDMVTIHLTSDHVTIVEYEIVEQFLLNSDLFELYFFVSSINKQSGELQIHIQQILVGLIPSLHFLILKIETIYVHTSVTTGKISLLI